MAGDRNYPLALRVVSDSAIQKATDCPKLLSFFDLAGMEKAQEDSQWVAEEEYKTLIDIAKDEGLDPKIRMSAIEMLHERRIELLKINGVLVTATQKQSYTDEDGTTVQRDMEAIRLLQPSLQKTQTQLEQTDFGGDDANSTAQTVENS